MERLVAPLPRHRRDGEREREQEQGEAVREQGDAITLLGFLFGGGNLIAPDGSLLDSVSTGCRVYPEAVVEGVPAPACAAPCRP